MSVGRCRSDRRHRRRRRGPRRLFWRVYFYGIALLITVALSVGFADFVLGSHFSRPWGSFHQIGGFVDAELTPLLSQPDELQAKVERVHRGFGMDAVVYSWGGERLAHAGAEIEPLEAPPDEPRWLQRGVAMPIGDGRAYVVARWKGGGWSSLLVPVVVLLALAFVSVPLARNIVRPVERITQAARAIGDGQLDARTGVKRRDEVGALAAAFDDMATRLERLVEGEKELRANVSHELRTPLARIRVALEIAEEGSDPKTVQKHLRGIRADIIELEELVDQVMITARLDLASDDELGLRRSPTQLSLLVAQSAERFANLHPGHRLELDLGDDDSSISADPKLVKRVLDNLLDNSAKYAAASDGPIHVEVRHEPAIATVTVSDRGIGVDVDDLERLFEPFFRADSVRSKEKKGVGLGLSFCRRVVVAHGGQIHAERRDGGGLSVRFELPTA